RSTSPIERVKIARRSRVKVPRRLTPAVASELQQTWKREDAGEGVKVYTTIFPPYQLLIEGYQKARAVEQQHETLDSMRK
ncbi:MAG: hypothetical protein K2X43_24465, partial [Hyphomonadaceae bacterium]|nr:hypothetical protein [Hyphomonadaceae bacterium]